MRRVTALCAASAIAASVLAVGLIGVVSLVERWVAQAMGARA